LGASAVDGPGSGACARGQANIALRTESTRGWIPSFITGPTADQKDCTSSEAVRGCSRSRMCGPTPRWLNIPARNRQSACVQ
jgi:hypothetical protein